MAVSDNVLFRELLRRHRVARAFSQEALAERAGLSVDAIRALERGRRAAPRADTMTRLMEALELGPTDRQTLIAASTGQGESEPGSENASAHPQILPTGGFLGSLPAGRLIGRGGELAAIAAALESAARGEGRAIFLAGEAGIGKTRLGQEVTRHAAGSGFLVLAGRSYAAEQSVPYYPFLEVFATAYEAAPAGIRESAGERWPYLGVLLPNQLAPPGTGGSDEQQRVLFAAGAFLAALSAEAPMLLLLDDLHWADSASLRLLHHLTRQGRSSRLLILATIRDLATPDDHPLNDLLRDLSREGLLEKVSLPRLDRTATAELMAATMEVTSVPPQLAELIHARTEGNPFFTAQLTRALVERGDLDRVDGGAHQAVDALELPETIRAVIRQRVRRLSAEAQQILHEASVLGDTFHPDDLAGMAGMDEEDLDQPLAEAERIGLIRERAAEVFGFDHGLTRQALYQELPGRQRRRLHRRAGEAIEALPARRRESRAAELAWHFLEGDQPDRALPYALAAGDRAEAMFAHVEAELHYRAALRMAEETGDDDALAEIHERLAAPLHHAGRYEEALEALERAAFAYERRGDLCRLMPVMAEIAGVHGNRGTPAEGLERLLSVLPRFESSEPSPALVYLYAAYGSLLFVLGRTHEHLELAQRLVTVAKTLEEARARAIAGAQLGLALLSVRRRNEGQVVLEEAMVLAEEADDLATLGHALNNVAYLAELRGELDRSVCLFERGLALARRVGNPAQSVFMMVALARNHLYRGEWERARAYAEEAILADSELGASWVAPYPIIGRARIMMLSGEWERAAAELERGLDVARANADRQAREHAQRLLAELDLLQGRPEGAGDRLSDVGVPGGEDGADGTGSLSLELTLARTRAAQDRLDEATALIERVIARAEEAGELLVVADAISLHIAVLARQENWRRAEEAYARAVDLFRMIPYPYAEAWALEEAGWMYAARGMRDRADELRTAAGGIFSRLGAARDAERLAG